MNISAQDCERFYAEADKQGLGQVSIKQLVEVCDRHQAMSKQGHGSATAGAAQRIMQQNPDVQKAFQRFDRNNKGVLEKAEVIEALRSMQMSKQDAEKFFA